MRALSRSSLVRYALVMTVAAAPAVIMATPASAASPRAGYAVVEYHPATPATAFVEDSHNTSGAWVSVSHPTPVTSEVIFANLASGLGLANGADPGGVVHVQRTNSAQLGVCIPGQPLVQGIDIRVVVTCKNSAGNTALMGFQLTYTKGLTSYGFLATARVNGASVVSTGGAAKSTPTGAGRYTVELPLTSGFGGIILQVTATDPAGIRCRLVQTASGDSYDEGVGKIIVFVACTNAFTGALTNSPFNVTFATGSNSLGDNISLSRTGGPVQKLTDGNPVSAFPYIHLMYDYLGGGLAASRVDQGYTFVRAGSLATRRPARGVVLATPVTPEAALQSDSADECVRHGDFTTAPAIGPLVEGTGLLCRDRTGAPRDTAYGVELLVRHTPFATVTDVPIPDEGIAFSPAINVQGVLAITRPILVDVVIEHPYRGDLSLHLIAPDGTPYLLKPGPAVDPNDDVRARFTVYNAIGESPTGPWKLKMEDGAANDTGTLRVVALHF